MPRLHTLCLAVLGPAFLFIGSGCTGSSAGSHHVISNVFDADGRIMEYSIYDTLADRLVDRRYIALDGRKFALGHDNCRTVGYAGGEEALDSLLLNRLEWPPGLGAFEGAVILAMLLDREGRVLEARPVKEVPGYRECTDSAIRFVTTIAPWERRGCAPGGDYSAVILSIPFQSPR